MMKTKTNGAMAKFGFPPFLNRCDDHNDPTLNEDRVHSAPFVVNSHYPGDLPMHAPPLFHFRRRSGSLDSAAPTMFQTSPATRDPTEVYPVQLAPGDFMEINQHVPVKRLEKRMSKARQASGGRFLTAPISFDEIREVDEEIEDDESTTSGGSTEQDEDSDSGSCGTRHTFSLFPKRRSYSMTSSRSSPASLSSSPSGRSVYSLPPSALRMTNPALSAAFYHHRSFESLNQLKLGLLLPPIPEERRVAGQNVVSPLTPLPSQSIGGGPTLVSDECNNNSLESTASTTTTTTTTAASNLQQDQAANLSSLKISTTTPNNNSNPSSQVGFYIG